jgi:hypothetical protein
MAGLRGLARVTGQARAARLSVADIPTGAAWGSTGVLAGAAWGSAGVLAGPTWAIAPPVLAEAAILAHLEHTT